MFVLSQSTSYTWPVTVAFPVSGGKFEKQTFDAEFKRIGASKIREMTAAAGSSKLSDVDFVREVVIGWSGVSDGSGEVPFSNQALDQLLEIPLVASSIVQAFFDSIAGSRTKN